MRLDVPSKISSGRSLAAAQGAPDPVSLTPFFAGMTQSSRKALENALEESGGLILVAGPEGSGRAATVRGLMRARPDALAIGSIGSHESAAAALRTARGRLVLATAAAGDALGAIGRLAALGVEPFSIACVLRLVLAQRQVRRLCPACRLPVQPPNSVTAPLGLEPGVVVYRAQGCGTCEGSGFAGPIGVFETLPVDSTVGRLIVCGADEASIANHVFRKWPNLAAAVRALVARGFTTPEEAIELLRPQRQ
ncbi:MAG TPA: ATPase, T2SS/T4P/T4SS family [Allosphingosinicella sp.]|jgi:general secretion pathway protein E